MLMVLTGKERPRLHLILSLEQWRHPGANFLIVPPYSLYWFNFPSGLVPHEKDCWLCSRQASAELWCLIGTWECEPVIGLSSNPHVGLVLWEQAFRLMIEEMSVNHTNVWIHRFTHIALSYLLMWTLANMSHFTLWKRNIVMIVENRHCIKNEGQITHSIIRLVTYFSGSRSISFQNVLHVPIFWPC